MPGKASPRGANDAFFRPGSDIYRGGPPEGALQKIHPAARVLGSLVILLGVSVSTDPLVLMGVFCTAIAIAILSFLNLKSIYKLMLVPVVLLALPAWLVSILWYSGLNVASLFFVRTLASVSVVLVMLHSVGLRQVTGVMAFLRFPYELRQMWTIMIAQIASFSGLVSDMILARKARQVVRPKGNVVRMQVGRQAGILFARTWQRGNELSAAQAARSIADEPGTPVNNVAFGSKDYLFVGLCIISLSGVVML